MRVLIPGIGGTIGKMVAQRLLREGHEVIGIDRRRWADAPEGIEHHHVDIRKRAAEDVFRTRRPEIVIHLATVSHAVAQREERYRINLEGTRAVFEHCRRHGAKQCVFVGRHTYYGAAPDSPLYHTEDEPPHGLDTAVLRMCYTLGPTGHGTLATFLKGSRVPAVMGFDPLYQFMHERDVVSAICLAVEKGLRGVYNVAGPPPVPLSVLVRETGRRRVPLPEIVFAKVLGRFGLPSLSRGALSHIKHSVVIDSASFRAATGFVHQISEDEAIRQFAEAFPIAR